MKKALVVGIDAYPNSPLYGCVNDATAIATCLSKNGDGSPNFSVKLLTSDDPNADVTNAGLHAAVQELFAGNSDTVLFYFAGHGLINNETNAGYIVGQDGSRGAWGLSLAELAGLANAASPRIKSVVIILDSCHSGYAGEVAGIPQTAGITMIGSGVTIMTACHREQTAAEQGGQGVFTSLLIDGLEGSAADIMGNVSPPSLYALIDQTLGPWEQRPLYKANVESFLSLRKVSPKILPEKLRRLPQYFPDPATVFQLDPSYEPDRQNIPEELRHLPVNDDHVRVFKELQEFNRHGLVVPVDAEHMYYAAIGSKGCRLTALGAHYRKLAHLGRI